MRLNRLAVTDYRNLSAAVLEPAPQLTVLCGANGQGKTNLLEAVWLLTGGKSFRGAKDAELIRRGADFAVLEAAFEAGDRPQEIRLTVGAKGTQRPGRTAFPGCRALPAVPRLPGGGTAVFTRGSAEKCVAESV